MSYHCISDDSYQDVFKEGQALTPLDQLEQPLVRHIGQSLNHILSSRNAFIIRNVQVFVIGTSGEPEMLYIHDFL